MTTFTTIALYPQHAARIRELAKHFDMNVTGFAGTLINLEYERVFGKGSAPIVEKLPTLVGKKLRIEGKSGKKGPDGQIIEVLLEDVSEVADMIHKVATVGGSILKVDGLRPVSVHRKGVGVVIESTNGDGETMRISLSPSAAITFAARMHEAVAKHIIDDIAEEDEAVA